MFLEKLNRRDPYGFRIVIFHFRMGIRYRIPVCCIIHFCWDNILDRAAGMTRWKQISHDRANSSCVPCGLFHPGGSPLPLPKRLWRMLSFEWTFLQPTKQGKRRREFVSHGGQNYRESSVKDRQNASDRGNLEELWWQGL